MPEKHRLFLSFLSLCQAKTTPCLDKINLFSYPERINHNEKTKMHKNTCVFNEKHFLNFRGYDIIDIQKEVFLK